MKCTDRNKIRKRKRRNRWVRRLSVILIVLCIAAVGIFFFKHGNKEEYIVKEYEETAYAKALYQEELFASDLCVATENVSLEGAPNATGTYAMALFDVNDAMTLFSSDMHKRVFPASTTKILTALVAIKNGNLDDVVTVSSTASSDNFAADEATCGIKTGDQLTLRDLLYGLMLYSGNDTAVAIAEHIAGSHEAFVEMMNAQAAELMATNSHFMNSNGLHRDEHYTTAYDLYLIFNECIKHEEFIELINVSEQTIEIKGADGSTRKIDLKPTHYYAQGKATPPSNVTVIGGKTGTTLKAGNCLILLEKDANENSYISVVLGADTRELLYQDMTAMIEAIPET